jgi:hypothetical protein
VIKIKKYSWVDPPLSIPYANGRGRFSYPSSGRQIEGMVEFLKGLMVELDAPMVKLVERHMCSSEGYRRGVWKKLVCFEDHKKFFGTEVVDVLEGFQGKRLKSVDMCGTVDERWMRVVADAIGITVRAKVGEDDEWVVAGPRGVEES